MNRHSKYGRIFFAEPDDAALASTAAPEHDGADDVKPDFSSLGKPPEPEHKPAEEKPAPNASEKPAEVKTGEEAGKPAEAAPAVTGAQIDPKETATKPGDKPLESKPAETAPEIVIPEDDKDIEALEPPEGLRDKDKVDFKKMRELLKKERDTARKLDTERKAKITEIEELKKKGDTLTPELDTELKELRELRARTLLAEDPIFKAEYGTKLDSVQKAIIKELQAQGMGENMAEEDKKALFEKELWENDGEWWKKEVIDKLDGQFLVQERIKQGLLEREKVLRERDEKLAAIKETGAALTEQQARQRDEENKKWSETLGNTVKQLASKNEWSLLKEITDKMTPQEKADAEAHNAKVQEVGKKLEADIAAIYNRDPVKIAEVGFAYYHAQKLQEKLATVEALSADYKKRLDEAEDLIARSKNAGRIINRDNTPPADTQKRTPGKDEVVIGDTARDIPPDFSGLTVRR